MQSTEFEILHPEFRLVFHGLQEFHSEFHQYEPHMVNTSPVLRKIQKVHSVLAMQRVLVLLECYSPATTPSILLRLK